MKRHCRCFSKRDIRLFDGRRFVMKERKEVLDFGMTFPDGEIKRMIAESYDLIVGKNRIKV